MRFDQRNIVSRFLNKVKIGHAHECWNWSAGIADNGYGKFVMGGRIDKSTIGAHRASYLIFNGFLPRDLVVCHVCDNKKCVNPNHLFLGTAEDNQKDCVEKGRHRYSGRTHCKRGHRWIESNMDFRQNGERRCKLCRISRKKL